MKCCLQHNIRFKLFTYQTQSTQSQRYVPTGKRLEDTKGVIRGRKSKKNRHYNIQKKKDKKTDKEYFGHKDTYKIKQEGTQSHTTEE